MTGIQSMSPRPAFKRLVVTLTVLAGLLVASNALADRTRWRKTTINESNESWRADVEFHMSKPPDIAHVPMRFEFLPTVYYERSLVDGKKEPIERQLPLVGKSALVEGVEVGFSDPGTGKTVSRTLFTFKLTRDRGFEAGEYKVTIVNKRNGNKLGAPITLKLKGENPVIDRREMDFSDAEKKPKKKVKEKEAEPDEPAPDPNSDEFWEGGSEAPDDSLPPPAHLQDKPGACGCRLVGGQSGSGGALVGLFGLVALPLLRRRRR